MTSPIEVLSEITKPDIRAVLTMNPGLAEIQADFTAWPDWAKQETQLMANYRWRISQMLGLKN